MNTLHINYTIQHIDILYQNFFIEDYYLPNTCLIVLVDYINASNQWDSKLYYTKTTMEVKLSMWLLPFA